VALVHGRRRHHGLHAGHRERPRHLHLDLLLRIEGSCPSPSMDLLHSSALTE
jgi:hypothetical protein